MSGGTSGMGSSSVLIDCQIARTLGSSQKEIEAYTATRYALRCAGSSVGQLLAAIKELELMRPWARTASLPDLCSLCRRKIPAVANAIQETTFAALIEACPEALRLSLANCLNELPDGGVTDILIHVRELAALLTLRVAHDEPDETCFSLERNEEVSLLLAILETLVAESSGKVSELLAVGSKTGTRGGTPLDLIDRCLEGDFGRTQLIQAVDVSLEMGELHRARTGLSQVKTKYGREVDVLHRYARIAYLSSPYVSNEDAPGWAVKELQLFGTLQDLAGKILDGDSRIAKLELVALWQDAVLGTARRTGQASALQAIGKLLKPRVIQLRASVTLSLPGWAKQPRVTADLYRDLLWEVGEDVKGVQFETSGLPASYGIAPWFYPDWKRMRPKMPWLPHATSLFVRIASWSVMACELLASGSQLDSEDEGTKYLGFYLLHAYHWLDALERAVRQNRANIESGIYQIASSARLIVEQVAGGQYEEPSPAFFIQLTNTASETGFLSKESSENDLEDTSRKQDSVDRLLDTALSLAQRALAVTEDEPRAGRWLEDAGYLSDKAIQWFAGRKRVPTRASNIARCFKRFFEKETLLDELTTEDPLDSVRRSGNWASVYREHRAVLLREATRHVDWTCGEEKVPIGDSGYAAPLTVAVQRLVSALSDPSTPSELRDEWVADFRRLLAASTQLLDFDRFLQCRLVEVLEMRLHRNEAVLATMIISRLLEFGSNYTFATLIQWLRKDPVESDTDANLRIQIFDTLSLYIRTLETARARTDEPLSPESRARRAARASVLERLAATSLIPPPREGRMVDASILIAARQKRDGELARPLENLGTPIPVEIDDRGRILPISRDSSAHDLRMATLVAFDAAQLTVRRIGPPRSGPDGHNLFAGASPPPESRQSYLGIVAAARDGDGSDTKISFDAKTPAIGVVDDRHVFDQGQIVCADCEPLRGGSITLASIRAVRPLAPVHPIEHWKVSATPQANSLGVDFRAHDRKGKLQSLTQHTVNLLAIFSLHPEFTSFTARFAASEGEIATPAAGRFIDLLLDEAEQFDVDRGLALCLRSVTRTERGRISEIEVETSPFRYYRLRLQSDLTSAAAEKLETTFGRLDSDDALAGLFILTQLIVDGQGPKLALSPDGGLFRPRWSNATLHAPFDDRNLRWRDLFIAQDDEDESSDPLAEALECTVREGGRDHLANLPPKARVDGFPATVIIQFASRPRGGTLILGTVDRDRDGSPYRGVLHADEVSVSNLSGLNPADLKKTVDWLIDGAQERLLRIRTFIKNVPRLGLVRAFTAENLPVLVPAESLSLVPIQDSVASLVWQPREAIGRPRYRRTAISPRFDISLVPESAFEGDIARGILTTIPISSEGPCIVAWRTGQTLEQKSLLIENLSEVARRRLDLGSRLTVDRRSTPATLTLEEPNLTAEALWQISEPDTPPNPATYVGTTEVPGLGRHDLFETQPGSITYAPAAAAADTVPSRFSESHLADCSVIGLTDWSGMRPPDKCGHDDVWRVAYAIEATRGARSYLCGFSATKKNAIGRVRLTGYELEVAPAHSAGSVRIRRRLRCRTNEGHVRADVPTQTSSPRRKVDESARRQHERARLVALWRSVPYIEGRHDAQRNVFTPSDPFAQKLIPEGIAIAPSNYSRRSPTGPTSEYSRQQARLALRDGEPLTGSYLDVPATGIDDLIFALGNPPVGRKSNVDELGLCYVGIDRKPDGRIFYLFEWGYGCWARLDSESLRYKGRPIDEAELVLAFGDWIKSVRLSIENDATIMSVEEVELAPSHALYKQAIDHKILHVLRVSSSPGGDVRIDGLDAFDSRQATSIIRPFTVGAVLEAESAREVARLLANRPSDGGQRQTVAVYGRMITEKFENTGGREVVYRAVSTTGRASAAGLDGLRAGDRIFVRASTTKVIPNDLGLVVTTLSDFESGRAAADSNPGDRRRRDDEWIVTRRLFSFDESALARITSTTGVELENRVLLVCLEEDRRNRFTLSHRDGAPARSSELLDGLLSQAGGRLFCVFAGWGRGEAKGTILLEVRPGALIRLERRKVEWPQDEFEVGDILRLERRGTNENVPYRAIFAIFNDRRYARTRRPVVALPKNPLRYLKPPFKDGERDTISRALANFGVGDFRQISAVLDVNKAGSDGDAAGALEAFMRLRHPKLAWLHTNAGAGGSGSALSPNDGSILAGRLKLQTSTDGGASQAPRIRVLALAGASAELERLSVRWSQITFADAPAKQISDNLSKTGWHYHDRQTIVWRRTSDQNVEADSVPLERHNIRTGPLFFERDGNTATLRYRPDQIERHVIGFANLRGYLPSAKTAAVRGVVAYATPNGGLYVELIPGRIYDVPSALCSSDERDSIILDRLDWNLFGTGDRISLRRASEQAGRHGQEGVLLRWTHGLRNSIGLEGALMPRIPLRDRPDSAVYGTGRFTVTLPTDPTETLPDLAIVGNSEALRPFISSDSIVNTLRTLAPGTTLLLCSRDGMNIEIEGLPGVIPTPATSTIDGKQISWRTDSLLGNTVLREGTGLTVGWELILEKMRVLGGAIPATFEAFQVDENSGTVHAFFSRRYQDLVLQDGACALATVAGFIASHDLVVLAVGGRHLEIPIESVITGAPKALWREIVETLARVNAKVWLQKAGVKYRIGLGDETSRKFSVRSFALISAKADEEPTAAGLVCISVVNRRLYWLRADEIGVTRLTPKQLSVAFPLNGPAFEALLLTKASGISLTQDTRLRNELKQLRPGSITSVRPIPGAVEDVSSALPQFAGPTSGKAILARLTGTGLLISLLLEENDLTEGTTISAEIAWRWREGGSLRLTAVMRGKRRVRPDALEALFLKATTKLDPNVDIIYQTDPVMIEAAKQANLVSGSSTPELVQRAESIRKEPHCSLRVALTILSRLGENSSDLACQQAFWTLASDVGKRALRSFHLEPLAKRHAILLRGNYQEDVAPGLNNRIAELLDMVNGPSGSAPADQIAERIEALVLFARLYPQPDRAIHLVHALSAALGGRHDLNVLLEHSDIIGRVSTLLRPFGLPLTILSPFSRSQLVAKTATACAKIETHLADEDFDIPMPRCFTMSD